MKESKKHIVIGLSGGVDSSVAAYLLKQQGHNVTAVFMQNWQATDDPYCSAQQDLSDARAVCDKLAIPLKTVNFAKEYWQKVFTYFLDELAAGRTPNPDIICNQEIKFKAFLNYALSLGADLIATGHYALIEPLQTRPLLLKGKDDTKDQSYFLHRLSAYQLQHSLFPIGHLHKKAVRQIANEIGLINFAKKDSTGICFIGERKFQAFISEYLLAKPGNIETDQGKVIGQHQGLMFYTLGQRQGLGIGGLKHHQEAPWYVLNKDIDRNILTVGQDINHPLLLKQELNCNNIHWIDAEPSFPARLSAKIRYRQNDQPCILQKQEQGYYRVLFDLPQRAITPGQAVVFYQGDICLGGGTIIS